MGMRGTGGPRGIVSGSLADKTRARPVSTLLVKLWQYLKKDRNPLITVSIVITIYAIISTVTPIIFGWAIDIHNMPLNIIIILIFSFIFLSVIQWIFDGISSWISAEIQARLIFNVRNDTFSHLVDADMSFHQTYQSGTITSRVIGDTEEVANGISVFTNMASQLLLVFTTFGYILFFINYVFAIIALLAIPIAYVLIKILSGLGGKRMLKTRQSIGYVTGKIAEALNGISISKSFNREDLTSQEVRKLNNQYYEDMVKLGVIFTMVMPAISMLSTVLVALVLLAGGYIGTITIGKIYVGTILVQRFLAPIVNIGSFSTQLQASLAAFDRLVDIQESKPAITNDPEAVDINLENPSIIFDHVFFSYKENEMVLKDLNFSIKPGEKVALVGHTGAGKTSISALLMRFYDPVEGGIYISGQDIRKVTLESLMQTISLVPQEPYLFADTVIENLRYGKPDTTTENVLSICKLIGADQFIEALPNGYETILTESGKNLSAGQRQMITIARTMIKDPKILILDEATSRLDAYSESLVQQAQKILFQDRTTIVIAHRLSTIRDVDKIIVLDHGKIIEQGTNDELLKAEGKYYQLYKTYYAHQGVAELEEPDAMLTEEPEIKINPIINKGD